jgi:pilus assembly protein CpaE
MATVLIIDDDANTLRLIGYMLERVGFEVQLAGDGEDGLAKASKQPPDLIVLDVMMPGVDGYQVCEQLRANPRTATIPVIILTARSQRIDQQTALEVGADLYLPKPVAPEELIASVNELLSRPPGARPSVTAEAPTRRLISVFSLRGGVGVTSLATNLAVALAQQYGDTVSLVDLSLTAGHAAIMLNLRPRRTVAHLLAGELDSQAVREHLLLHTSGVRLLAAPHVPPPPGVATADAVKRLLGILKSQYGYTVIDTPSSLDEVTLSALSASDQILLVLSPEVLSVQTTLVTRQALQARGIALDKVRLVLNQVTPKPALPQKAIEQALKQSLDLILPYEEKQALAIVKGEPLLIGEPTSPLASAIKAVSVAVSAGR